MKTVVLPVTFGVQLSNLETDRRTECELETQMSNAMRDLICNFVDFESRSMIVRKIVTQTYLSQDARENFSKNMVSNLSLSMLSTCT